MKIIKAKTAGFCFGVKRAVDSALKLNKKVNTLGPLIHNPQFIKELEDKGIRSVDSIKDAKGILVIRTHGVHDKVISQAEKSGLKVIDLTCPFVKTVQNYAKDLNSEGYKVIVVGEKDHPEVKGIVGNINAIIVKDPKEAKNLGKYKKLGVVAQTTQSKDNFNKTVIELFKHADDIKFCNTVCSATSSRQKDAIELAKQVDLMVVIGGYNSANTHRLAELSKDIVKTIHIETADELKKSILSKAKKVGVTAGASTPDKIIDQVIDRIKQYTQ